MLHEIQSLYVGSLKILRAPFEWSPAPGIHAGSPPPTPASFCAEAPNSHLLPTQVLVSESSNQLHWEGRESQESSCHMPGRSCLAAFLLIPEGSEKSQTLKPL